MPKPRLNLHFILPPIFYRLKILYPLKLVQVENKYQYDILEVAFIQQSLNNNVCNYLEYF